MSAKRHAVILGATSAIAEATARLYASEGTSLTLVGRRTSRLEEIAQDLRARGAPAVSIAVADLAQPQAADAQLAGWSIRDTRNDILLFYGALTDQAKAERDMTYAREQLNVGFTSAAEWCLAAANLLEAQGRGSLVVIGSVAGDRGRQSNYVYGAAKAGLGALVQGVAHRLALKNSGARAVLIKPGFVDTPMTDHLPKGGPLWAKPDAVAQIVRTAADRGGPIVYAPGFWRLIMLVIRTIPAGIFHKRPL